MASDTNDVTGLTGRYARALFQLAEEQDVLDLVAEELATIAQMIEESEELERLVSSPVIPRLKQGSVMEEVLIKAGASQLTRNFVGLIASNRRLFALNDMISDYLQILAKRRGEVTAEVISAEPLDNKQIAQLLSLFKSNLGEKVNLTTKIDAGLLGGLVIKIGSRMVDSSLRNKLQQLRLALKGVG